MTTRPPSDSDGWYDPDPFDGVDLPAVSKSEARLLAQIREAGEYRRSDPPVPPASWSVSASDGTCLSPAPVPEGMETTPQSRALILSAAVDRPDTEAVRIIALLRDLDRALAEIARLSAINADLCAVNLRHAEESARLSAAPIEQAAEALRNSSVLLTALTGPDDAIASATINGNSEALARLTAEQPPVPPDRELFDALHIGSLINEWFAPVVGFEIEQSHIDGLCTVLRRRLLRSPADGWRAGAEAMREACAPASRGDDMSAPRELIEQYAARIAELEAARDQAERERFRFGALNKGLSNRIVKLEAALDEMTIPSPPAEETKT